ncbi:MAG TPA: hypothetical protein VN457_01535 [Chlamydiales bacterium]|nr:hypothetical protein [Chlamydiales bacterium]
MWMLALVPFFLQAVCIGIDEAYFHIKRGLPLWERIGHPIDTLSFLICLFFTLWMPFTDFNLKVYIALAIGSCIMVTKDEFVHKHHCPAAENWLHALLFILHPITLIMAGCMWPVIQGQEIPQWLAGWFCDPIQLYEILVGQAVFITLFFFYQIIFWNFIWNDRPVKKM